MLVVMLVLLPAAVSALTENLIQQFLTQMTNHKTCLALAQKIH